MKKPLLIAICGPTASGKTSLAISLAKWLNTSILSFDSRQFYKELKIGAAPPTPEELNEAEHHFIQHLSITQEYNAGKFERDALLKLDSLFKNNEIVIAVGGSGMYLKALEEGFDDLPENIEDIRNQLNTTFKEEGLEILLQELKKEDPAYYNSVDRKNPIRVIRALEVIRISGKPYSEQRGKVKKERPFNVLKIAIDYPRAELYNRINLRVDLMIKAGLMEETRALYDFKEKNALQTVGYKEWFNYFEEKWELPFTIEEIKKNSRRYAKRQLTWFRRDANMNWINPNHLDAAQEIIETYIKSH